MIGKYVKVNSSYRGITFAKEEKVRIEKYVPNSELCYKARAVNGIRSGWLKKDEIT